MLSKEFLTERGYCCGHGCLMCPYEPKHIKDNTILKIINCLKEENNVIKKKLKEVSVEEGMAVQRNYFKYLTKEKTGLASRRIKWELMHKWPLSMFVNLWYSSIRRLYQRKMRLSIMKVVYLTLAKEYTPKDTKPYK